MRQNRTIGKDALWLCRRILKLNPTITKIQIIKYKPAKLVQERIHPTTKERRLLEKATHLKKKLNLPFWDAVLLCCFSQHDGYKSLLDAATYHRSFHGQECILTREEVICGRLEDMCQQREDYIIALLSEVLLKGGTTRHLPLIDFHCPVAEENEKLACYVLSKLLPNDGILLRSDDSYHGWGSKLLTEEKILDLLARSLLFCPVIDRGFIAHQLIERRSALRISSAYRGGISPTVVWVNKSC